MSGKLNAKLQHLEMNARIFLNLLELPGELRSSQASRDDERIQREQRDEGSEAEGKGTRGKAEDFEGSEARLSLNSLKTTSHEETARCSKV